MKTSTFTLHASDDEMRVLELRLEETEEAKIVTTWSADALTLPVEGEVPC